MPTIVVEVMPKAELLDPQGKAIAGALARTGRGTFDVRQGKRFELTTDAEATDELLASVAEIAADVLSNGVIEDVVSVHVAADTDASDTDASGSTEAGSAGSAVA